MPIPSTLQPAIQAARRAHPSSDCAPLFFNSSVMYHMPPSLCSHPPPCTMAVPLSSSHHDFFSIHPPLQSSSPVAIGLPSQQAINFVNDFYTQEGAPSSTNLDKPMLIFNLHNRTSPP
ncbi:hypothetical protein M0R45_028677 [Rubus argutus]|uniref:Uncharacterized protein n=1 Tax=Rubus argutus TaxID=59490 RepID=A0AAW1W5E7_RUBAR